MGCNLVIDTSREFILLGLIKDGEYAFKKVEVGRELSKYLVDELVNFLNEHNCTKSDLSSICCGRGPGAFTGVRLALSIAKTMSFALKIDLYSFSSIVFYNLFVKDRKVIGIDDARSYKYYYGLINKDTLETFEGIDEDPNVVEYCDLRDDFKVVSTRNFVNISTELITDLSYFDVEVFEKIITFENHYTFKPEYIKKIDSEK